MDFECYANELIKKKKFFFRLNLQVCQLKLTYAKDAKKYKHSYVICSWLAS